VEQSWHAALERHAPGRRGAVDGNVEPGRQRVDDRQAEYVQATRGDVRPATELAPGVQPGADDLDAGQAGAGLDVDRDAAAAVVDLGGAVGVQDHRDLLADPGQRLVHAVVDDLPQTLHQTAGVGR